MQYGKAIFNILNGVIGVGNRIYPVMAPQMVTLPYVVYKTISIVSNATHNKTSSVNSIRVQLDIIANSFESCQDIEQSIRGVLSLRDQGAHGTDTTIQQIEYLGMNDDQYDQEDNNFIVSADYEIREIVNTTD